MDIKKNEKGNLVISEDVVAKIASVAANEVEGVAGVVAKSQDIKSIIKTQQVTKPVHVIMKDNQLFIDIYVKIKEGVKVTSIATKIQEGVKEAVQNMTGTVVTKVNVHICEIELNASGK